MITKRALTHIDSLKTQIPIWAKDAILENAEFIISILQDNQLSKGLDSTGSVVGTYFWETEYIYAKDPDNRPRKQKNTGEPYNFEWSGEFFDSMNIKVDTTTKEFDIFSSTGKDKFLEKQFGTDLTQFTKENNSWVNKNIIEPFIAKKIKENLFKF